MFLLQYEKAVLEWFNAAYPPLLEAIYTDNIDDLLALDRIIKYPSLVYSRQSADMALPRAMDVYCTKDDGTLEHGRMFSFEQVYTAKLLVEKQSEVWRAANAIRQRWSYDSYAHLKHPDADWSHDVGMRLLSFQVDSERSNLNDKGAMRVLTMQWRSALVLEDYDEAFRWDSYQIVICPNGVHAQELVVGEGPLPIGGVVPASSLGDVVSLEDYNV